MNQDPKIHRHTQRHTYTHRHTLSLYIFIYREREREICATAYTEYSPHSECLGVWFSLTQNPERQLIALGHEPEAPWPCTPSCSGWPALPRLASDAKARPELVEPSALRNVQYTCVYTHTWADTHAHTHTHTDTHTQTHTHMSMLSGMCELDLRLETHMLTQLRPCISCTCTTAQRHGTSVACTLLLKGKANTFR